MNKFLTAMTAVIFFSTASLAGEIGIGLTGSIAKVSADGKEVTGKGTNGTANTNKKSVDSGIIGMGSIFAEYMLDNGVTFGFEHTPGEADVSSRTHERLDASEGVSGTDTTGSVTRKASALVENFNTAYVEVPVMGLYVKAGWSQIDVITGENKITDGGTYKDETLDGITAAIGVKGSIGGFYTKTSIEGTDFEELSLSSSTNNKITADLDVLSLKFSLGKSF